MVSPVIPIFQVRRKVMLKSDHYSAKEAASLVLDRQDEEYVVVFMGALLFKKTGKQINQHR